MSDLGSKAVLPGLVLLLCLAVVSCVHVPQRPVGVQVAIPSAGKDEVSLAILPEEAQDEVAAVLRGVLPRLVGDDERFARRLGFTAANDVANSEHLAIGHPFPLLLVGLETLKAYQPGASYSQTIHVLLFRKLNFYNGVPIRLIYPVLVKGVVRSSITVTFVSDAEGWRVSAVGSSQLARTLTVLKSSAGARSSHKNFVLWVPALNRYYLGQFAPNLQFIALFDDPLLALGAGQAREASDLFGQLKGLAVQLDGKVAR